MDKNICLTCINWKLTEINQAGKEVAHNMAKHRFGRCRFDETWRYFSAWAGCEKNQYESVDQDLKTRRIAWVKR